MWLVETYQVERWEWTTADFERMGWHDATIYAIANLPETWEVLLDIDYLLEWVPPDTDGGNYRFWVVPATLIFENVSSVNIELAPYGDITVQGLERGEPEPTRPGFEGAPTQWPWTVDCNEGVIAMRATGFRQVVRRQPVLQESQRLSLADRGGLSFARESGRAF